MPEFVVLRTTPGLPPPQPPADVWVLRPETLDDDGLRTTFTLSVSDAQGRETMIGQVKIGRAKVTRGPTPILSPFSRLGGDYMSVGAELDYYERLAALPGGAGRSVLEALRDLALDPAQRERHAGERVIEDSLLRFTPARSALERGAAIFGGGPGLARGRAAGLVFRTNAGGSGFTLNLNFDGVDELPGRINVLVGPNGTGKTRLLANLALAAFDSGDAGAGDRPWGHVEDGLSISRILAFSYSAFDDFEVPGDSGTRDAILEGSYRLGYGYFGLRDLSSRSGDPADGVVLKSQGRILAEFRHALGEAVDRDWPLLQEVLTELFTEASFAMTGTLSREDIRDLPAAGLSQRLITAFAGASTGHKFILLMTSQLLAQIREGSLVLVDEPEAHLHPPLLARFLGVVRTILAKRASWAIIATHSPFVVQETPARHVHVISRYVNETTATPPETETFGEDVGFITREIFRLDTRAGEYVGVLRDLAVRLPLDQIEALFDHGLSGQGRSLVLSHQRRTRG